MFSCSCASPACAVNGCSIARQYRQTFYAPPDPLRQGQCTPTPAPSVTPEDIRRIVREELDRAKQ